MTPKIIHMNMTKREFQEKLNSLFSFPEIMVIIAGLRRYIQLVELEKDVPEFLPELINHTFGKVFAGVPDDKRSIIVEELRLSGFHIEMKEFEESPTSGMMQ